MTRRPHNDAPQMVYFIRPVGMDGPIKIGCSLEPDKRLIAISAWSPFPLEMIGAVNGTFEDENRLHRRFSDLHSHGEWFMSSPLLRAVIDLILSGIPVKEACAAIDARKPIRNQKRPPHSSDRLLFLKYGCRVRRAAKDLYRSGEHTAHYVPANIAAILHNWRTDRVNNHITVIPTAAQFAELEEFIANPGKFCVPYSIAHPAKPELRSAA